MIDVGIDALEAEAGRLGIPVVRVPGTVFQSQGECRIGLDLLDRVRASIFYHPAGSIPASIVLAHEMGHAIAARKDPVFVIKWLTNQRFFRGTLRQLRTEEEFERRAWVEGRRLLHRLGVRIRPAIYAPIRRWSMDTYEGAIRWVGAGKDITRMPIETEYPGPERYRRPRRFTSR